MAKRTVPVQAGDQAIEFEGTSFSGLIIVQTFSFEKKETIYVTTMPVS